MQLRWLGWLLLWCIPALVALFAWQIDARVVIDIGGGSDNDHVQGFYAAERDGLDSYRWSSTEATLFLPAYLMPGIVELRGNEAPYGARVTLSGDHGSVLTLPDYTGPPQLRHYLVYWPTWPNGLSWTPLHIEATAPIGKINNRMLGMLFSEVRIQTVRQFSQPPLLALALLTLLTLLLWGFWRQFGLRDHPARLLAIAVGASLALAWALLPGWFYQYYLTGILALLVLGAILRWAGSDHAHPMRRNVAVLAVFGLALALRLYAVPQLETHWDEDDYLRAGQFYAQHIARGDLAAIMNERENYEHPPLSKLVFGGILYATQMPPRYQETTTQNSGAPIVALEARPLRVFNGVWGALTAALVAAVNPLAGLLVAVSSWHANFTALAMLEALPGFFSALTLLSLRRSAGVNDRWWWLAAVALGVAAAGKYLYAVPFGIASVIWMLWRQPRAWPWVFGWGALALLIFFLANPALWPDPIGRLYASLTFNTSYASGEYVTTYGYPWYQPLYWLFTPVNENRQVFPLLLDGIVAACALLAIVRLWHHDRLLPLWFGAGMIFLLLWPTKWNHYILVVTMPLALMAATFLQIWWERLARWRLGAAAQRRTN
ncbi:MAG: hypothetical protein EI684_04140 [Candidatus Viridilinea halotolerans]|uniref:Glycosyltransferase RgtA/B/C/D-like domain-containing protein n=1 Tax=Candidatus Viridilinea halotolerans TaxID=2491704 RepID=A0A426U6W8_9CHLR|nr:MAG: hypothetical protein EI684_04140 [Candidatus Viridilinea halotolerans]